MLENLFKKFFKRFLWEEKTPNFARQDASLGWPVTWHCFTLICPHICSGFWSDNDFAPIIMQILWAARHSCTKLPVSNGLHKWLSVSELRLSLCNQFPEPWFLLNLPLKMISSWSNDANPQTGWGNALRIMHHLSGSHDCKYSAGFQPSTNFHCNKKLHTNMTAQPPAPCRADETARRSLSYSAIFSSRLLSVNAGSSFLIRKEKEICISR